METRRYSFYNDSVNYIISDVEVLSFVIRLILDCAFIRVVLGEKNNE